MIYAGDAGDKKSQMHADADEKEQEDEKGSAEAAKKGTFVASKKKE